jgi:hypothetical protein
MDAKHGAVQILGWLTAIAGYGLALLLIRGFIVGHSANFWIMFAYVLFFALAAYLVNVGRRAILFAKGCPRPKSRFGWGRMLLGAIFLFSYAAQHFHFIPAGAFKSLEPSNQTQAVAMNVTTIAICVGCVLLILSGIWRGFRRAPTQPNPTPNA